MLTACDLLFYLLVPFWYRTNFGWKSMLPFSGFFIYACYKVLTAKVITRYDATPYLIRVTLFTCRWFSVKVHRILESDDACLHDHPWAFISFIVSGGYTEYHDKYTVINLSEFTTYHKHTRIKKHYRPGSVLFRAAKYAHRLELDKPATTLVFTFKKVRRWGFFTPAGWVFWRNYKQGENTCE